jgi:hypothetical protein
VTEKDGVSLHFNGIEVNHEHYDLLLQLEKRLGQVEYTIGSEPESGLAGVSKSPDDSAFIIDISSQYKGDTLACRVAHQLLYALQMKEGCPLTKPADPELVWQKILSESINNLILELKATDEATALGFDHSYIFNHRYKEVKDFADRHTGKALDSFQSRWFAVDLALALIFIPPEKINFLLSVLKSKEDEAVGLALSIINLIEKTGYTTTGRAFLAMAEINTLLDTWSYCPIHYGEKVIGSAQQYQTEFFNLRALLLG